MSIRTLPCRIKVKICWDKTNFFIGQNADVICMKPSRQKVEQCEGKVEQKYKSVLK